jgi:4-amino-4-deoxy-L-arabinose transferase-like glycosyltransferase
VLYDPGYDKSPAADNTNVMVAVTVAICAAWLLPGLIGHDPWKPDEAYTFGLVYEVLHGSSWVVPMLAGEPFLEKPPLFTLVAALFAKLFSFALSPHDGARLAAGFFVGLAFLFTAATGRELHGSGRGWISTLILLGSLGLLVRAHQMINDTAMFAGFAIATYGFARCLRAPTVGGIWLGTGAGLGFMAKGLLAPVAIAITGGVLIAVSKGWRSRSCVYAYAIATAAGLPWLVVWPALLYGESPAMFSEWIWTNHLTRIFSPDILLRVQELHYLSILAWYAWPALPLALWVLWGARISGFRKPAIELPCILFAVCLIVLSIATEPRELHAMPLLIPLALLATPAVYSLRRGASNSLYWFSVMGFSFFAVVFWIYWVALDLGIPERLSRHLHELQPGYDPHVRWPALLVALAFTAAWPTVLARLKRRPERPIVVWAAGITMLWGLATSLFVSYIDTGKSYRSMFASLAQALPKSDECISSRRLSESARAMLRYYTGIVTYRDEAATRIRSCSLLLQQGERSHPPEIPPGWHQRWEGTRPGEKVEYFWLYAFGPPDKP